MPEQPRRDLAQLQGGRSVSQQTTDEHWHMNLDLVLDQNPETPVDISEYIEHDDRS